MRVQADAPVKVELSGLASGVVEGQGAELSIEGVRTGEALSLAITGADVAYEILLQVRSEAANCPEDLTSALPLGLGGNLSREL